MNQTTFSEGGRKERETHYFGQKKITGGVASLYFATDFKGNANKLPFFLKELQNLDVLLGKYS